MTASYQTLDPKVKVTFSVTTTYTEFGNIERRVREFLIINSNLIDFKINYIFYENESITTFLIKIRINL